MNRVRAWLPYPLTSLSLFVVWLLINQTLAPAHILLALVLGLVLPLLTRALQPLDDPQVFRPLAILRLLTKSLIEIVRSCVNVSRIILSPNPSKVRSQFLRVPLDMRDPYGLAALSALINLTPGTVWVEVLEGSNELALHVFDLHDEQWWIDTIKCQYEAPLMDIFERRGGDRVLDKHERDAQEEKG